MLERLSTHIAAMRRQTRRLLWATVSGGSATLAASAFLMTASGTGWWRTGLGVLLAVYLLDVVRRLRWTRRTELQLGLEEQFVCHGPTPEGVRPCLRRRNHLWTSSLTLKGLKTLALHPPALESASAPRQQYLGRTFLHALDAVRPGRFPAGLLWFSALALYWIASIPEALLRPPVAAFWVGAVLLFVVLTAEVIATVLRSDVREGVQAFADLLGEWTERRTYDQVILENRTKRYRHTALYRSAPPVAERLEPAPARALPEAR